MKTSLIYSRSTKVGPASEAEIGSSESVPDSGLTATRRPQRKSSLATINNRRSNPVTIPVAVDVLSQEAPLVRLRSVSLPTPNDLTTVASRFKSMLSSTKSISRSKPDESNEGSADTIERKNIEPAVNTLSFLSFGLKDSMDSGSNRSSDEFGQLKPKQRSRRQSIAELVSNTFFSTSRPRSVALNDTIVETAKIPMKPPDVELEGPIFNSTIQQASTLGCKNGIPDIVVQCVEYLERKKLLSTEGLYRVPGSQKRVKEWCNKYQEVYKEREKRSSVLDRRRTMRKPMSRPKSLSASSIKKDTTTDTMMSIGIDQIVRPKKKSAEETNLSLMVAAGSLSGVKITPDELQLLSSPAGSYSSINQSIISLKFEESKRGVGLWGSDGLFSTVGFPVALDNETPSTVASLLKRFFSSIKDNFIPHGFWAEIDSIAITSTANSPPSEDILNKIRFYIELNIPSRQHLHTFAYFLLHLQRVAALAETNMMTPKNLALCIFTSAKEGGEFVIRYADLIFGNIDIVGREAVACLPFSETTSTFSELDEDTIELPKWDSTIDDLEPRLMRQWFEDIIPLIAPSGTSAKSDPNYEQNLSNVAVVDELKTRLTDKQQEKVHDTSHRLSTNVLSPNGDLRKETVHIGQTQKLNKIKVLFI
ncbi:Rho GTPase activation protein [Rhizoclosmatium globosum]|uniref:Rho GTPase activation protein n=1 Tax=Rhizoclosmatium globosum TaxID=329046 RepID=A0A1Y2C2Z7_9FUNG|nr:Rho GTPase activation protein [Rhizoclosmatium globosum]|eukprot:ORY41408.1 Rho GTPase activation protein [Rhizoclosmatium globosum]